MLYSCVGTNKETTMFVYIWKRPDGTPFYVGMTCNAGRTNPLNSGGRGWLCKQTLAEIGKTNVITEVHNALTLELAQEMERSFILKYGRIQLETGTLTNLTPGGDGGSKKITDAGRARLSEHMKIHNPSFRPEVRAKIKERMDSPDVKAKFMGENNPAKRPEVRAKLKAKWQDPAYQEAQRIARTGIKHHTEEHKESLRQKLLDPTNSMREYHKVLNSDPVIKAKRIATLNKPEIRAKIVAGLKASWAKRKSALAVI